jgi:hypothetical protein
MERFRIFVLALSLFAGAVVFSADSPGPNTFSEAVLIDTLEKGHSLVVAKVLSVDPGQAGNSCLYKLDVLRPLILGDIGSGDLEGKPEFAADGTQRSAPKVGHTYALFVRKPARYQISLADTDHAVEIDISEKTNLKELKQAALRAYQKTVIYGFRKNMPGTWAAQPELPAELDKLCDGFRARPTDRAEYARQIFESELGSRIDQHQAARRGPAGYYAPKIALSRWQLLHLLGPLDHISGWTYSWFCGPDESIPDTDKHVGVLSATFYKDERCIRLVYGLRDRSIRVQEVEKVSDKSESPDQEKAVMLQFQQALKDCDWEKALSVCSEKVRNKAKESDSAEAFFDSVVPIQQLVSISDFGVRSTRRRGGKVIRYGYDVVVRVPEKDLAYEWEWSVVRTRAGWVIDFKPYPLEVCMKHYLIRCNRKPGERYTTREQLRDGVEVRLLPVSREFVIGEPMLFRMELANVSNDTIEYPCTSWLANDPMVVKGPNGVDVPYMAGGAQVAFWSDFIEPAETIELVDSYDVSSQYRITEPGKYSFQFNCCIESSNIVEVEIKPGELSPMETVVQILTPILPEGWEITRHVSTANPFSPHRLSRRLGIHLIGHQGIKGMGGRFGLSIFVFLDAEQSQIEYQKYFGEFWGNSKWGPVYANAYGAELLWPDYREQIIEALAIQETEPD